MLRIQAVESFSFKMSVKNFGFPLPVKIEEDQKLYIDLDTEENSPEDIVIEWHLDIRRFFGSYSAASGEIKLVSIMKEYITAITERAIHFEHVVRLHEMVDNHMEHIYWFYRDSDICFSDLYLDYMEHIMTFYVNLTLRVLLVLKNKIKVTQEMVNDTTQKVIKRLSFYLLKSEYHIFHVLIRQTTTMVDGMIKDLMNILNSNICKQLFRNLYKYFLVMTPIRDMSEEAFCRAFILFENWKAFENYKHNEKIEKCMENIFNRSVDSIKDNEFLRGILMPKTSIMSELMKVMGCDPSITKAYFDYVKSKQKTDGEIIDDIGKLALEDVMLSDTESIDEDDGVDFEDKYEELFDHIMKDTDYNLEEIMLSCKNEGNPSEVTSEEQDPEILVLDTDSDSDVEIVSITPSNKQNPNTPRRTRNAAAQPISFLESISVDVDTTRRKYGFRTLGNFNNAPTNTTTDNAQSSTANIEQPPQTVPDRQDVSEVTTNTPIEILNIDDDIVETTESNTNVPVKENNSVVNIMQADTSGSELSKSDKVTSSDLEVPSLSPSNLSSDLSEVPMELEISDYLPDPNEKIVDTAAPKVVEVTSSSNTLPEKSISEPSLATAVQEVPNISKTAQVPIGVQTNGTINHICRCSQLLGTLALTEREERSLEVFPAISSTTSENVKVVTDNQDSSKKKEIEGTIAPEILGEKTSNSENEVASKDKEVEASIIPDVVLESNTKNSEVETMVTLDVASERNSKNIEVETSITPEVLEEVSKNVAVETAKESLIEGEFETTVVEESVTEENLKNSNVEAIIAVEGSSINSETEVIVTSEDVLMESSTTDEIDNTQHTTGNIEVDTTITSGDKSTEISKSDEVEATIATEIISKENVENEVVPEENLDQVNEPKEVEINNEIPNEEVYHLEEQVIEVEYPEKDSEQIIPLVPEVQNKTDTCQLVEAPTIPLEVHLDTLSITDSTKTVVDQPKQSVNSELKVNGALLIEDPEQCRTNDERTLQCDAQVTECRTECPIEECQETTNTRVEESITPLDTGQEPSFVPPLDTGQFDVNSPASPDDAPKSGDVKMLRVVGGLRKGQQHGEFGYPTPPGSEEEREKDTDEQTKLIYSHILPTQEQEDFMSEEIVVDDTEIDNGDLLERLSDEERELSRCPTPGIGKSYEQIVKDSVGSQNSSEDDDDEIVSKKCNSKDQDQDISFDEMEQFLKKCENDDYPQTNRKKRKRQKTVAEDSRSRKNSFTRSPKRVKINDEPETHFIPYDEDSKDDMWSDQNAYNPSSSSDDEEDVGRRSLAKRRPSPMPLSKYLSKRNGVNTHIPLSGRLSPEKPPPLKGILKRIEQRHTYHPLHPVDDEPETVVIVLHQREIGRGKRGSVEVKVYRKSFATFKVPFDDHKLCHHALVRLDRVKDDDLDVWGRVSVRTRDFEEEMYNQPEKPMYKIVFDKKSPQLNSNDRKYYCDPSITSVAATKQPNKSTLYESENEQGTVHLSTEISYPTPPVDPSVPISPPYFSPSSNSSSEFPESANLIPFQDIERALLVVEPDKSECREPAQNADKSIDMETIELLSNNADFHKMLRDLNGDVLIEKVPLISVEETADGVVTAFVNDNDLVSNLNSDEQLLKKVCQELESEAMASQNRLIVDGAFLEVLDAARQDVETYSATIPSDSFPLRVVSNTLPTSLRRQSYSSVPDPPLAHSGYTETCYPSTFAPKRSPSLVPPLAHMYPSDLSGYSLHQQPYPNLHARYPEACFSTAKSTPLTVNSPSVISMAQETYNVPDSSLIHSGYSEINASVASPQLKMPVYSVSPQTLPVNMKSFIPNPSVVYPEGLLSYPQVTSSSYTCSVPANCLIPNLPRTHQYSERKPIVPSPPLTSPPYHAISNAQHLDTSASMPSLISTSKCSKTLRCSSRCEPYNTREPSPTKQPQVKTDKRRKRLPKEVLTISQINESTADLSNLDNNNKTNSSIYPTTKPGIFGQTRSRLHSSRCLRVSQPTDYFYKTTRSRDPRLGQPLICVPPPFVAIRRKPNLRIHVCCPMGKKRWVRKKSLWQFGKWDNEVKIPIVNAVLGTTAPKPVQSSVERCCRPTTKVEPTPMFVEPTKKFVEPTQKFVEPTHNFVDPTQKFTEPTQKLVEPTQKFVESTQKFVEPTHNFLDPNQKFTEPTQKFVESTQKFIKPTQIFVEPTPKIQNFVESSQKFVEPTQNYVEPTPNIQNFVEPPRKFVEPTPKIVESKSKFVESRPRLVEPTPEVHFAVPTSAPPQNAHPKAVPAPTPNNEHVVQKTPARKRGRPPKNSKSHSKNACAQDNIPSTSKHIPVVTPRGVKACQGVEQKNYPATRSASQPRIEPLKIIKDPNSKNNYCKVVPVSAKTPGVPMTVPGIYDFSSDTQPKEFSHNAKQTENAENEVEFETHLPLKKRKLSMPVTSTTPTQPTPLARTREKKEEISYPATPMLSIADVYMQPRAFKTPAEKKQLPPESSNTVPLRYERASDSQFNCGLSPFTPSLYGYGKCPYSVDLDCNPYCPPPVLFPPESFSHTN